MTQELINVWMRNQLANEQILDEVKEQENLSDDCIKYIYTQFAHIHTIRYYNIEKQEKSLVNETVKLSASDETDQPMIRKHLKVSANLIAQILKLKGDSKKIKSYRNGAIGWIAYLINHEAHHRSKVMMKLKEDRVKFSKRLKFNLWDWK